MAQHEATIVWEASGDFRAGSYSRAHRWEFDGGASVLASSSPHVVRLPYSDPAGVDPEEALVASVSSCHMLWFLSLAQEAGIEVARYRDHARGMMGRDDRGRISLTRITLAPEINFVGRAPGEEELSRLHDEAHERCFIANSLRTKIVVEATLASSAAA